MPSGPPSALGNLSQVLNESGMNQPQGQPIPIYEQQLNERLISQNESRLVSQNESLFDQQDQQ